MDPIEQLNLCLSRIEAETQNLDILCKQAQSLCVQAIEWHEQQLEALENNNA